MSVAKSPADMKWGYEFGCDGTLDYNDAFDRLGVRSKDTVRKLAREGLIRKGQHAGAANSKAMFCKRSVVEYVRSRES